MLWVMMVHNDACSVVCNLWYYATPKYTHVLLALLNTIVLPIMTPQRMKVGETV